MTIAGADGRDGKGGKSLVKPMLALDELEAWPDDCNGNATMPETMLDALLVVRPAFVALLFALSLALDTDSPFPESGAELLPDEGGDVVCSAELVPREGVSDPSEVKKG